MSELIALLQSSSIMWIAVASVFGLLVGSFLNVVIYRLPRLLQQEWQQQCRELLEIENPVDAPVETLVKPRSRCSSCGKQITAWQNIPVLSYLFLRGKCANCKAHISLRYPVIELISGALTAYMAWRFGVTLAAFAAMLFCWYLLAMTMIDYDHQLLPDDLTLGLLWLGLLFSTLSLFASPAEAIIGAIAGYLSLWIVFQVFRLATGKEGMGYGDFKLFAALGAWIGWQQLPLVILLASAVGAFVGIALIASGQQERSKPIPFGPFLAAAGFIAFLWGETIINWYLGLYQ